MRAYKRILTTAALTKATALTVAVLTTATGAVTASKSEPGWRLESSLGAQIAVPATWAINDSGCGMTARPSVVRGNGIQTLCYTAEPPTKELAIIEEAPKPGGDAPKPGEDTPKPGVDAPEPTTPTTINEIPAQRGEKRLDDGRYAGWIEIPSRHVRVDVRTRDRRTTERILRSVRLVDTDHLGCPAQPAGRAKTPTEGRKSIVVCYYGGKDRLQASAEIKDDAAQRLEAMVNAAPPGRNPDRPPQSCDSGADPPNPDTVLLTEHGTVRIRFSSCTGRGMIDDTNKATQVTRSIVETTMAPIHAGYGISGDLPG